jgi:hypothetical protein
VRGGVGAGGRGHEQGSQGDGVPVGAGGGVARVEDEDQRALARRVGEETQRRAVLGLERRERARRGAERTENDREASPADPSRAEELVAQRRVAVAPRRDPRRRRASCRQRVLDRLVDGLAQPASRRRAYALQLGHEVSRAFQPHARGVAFVERREAHFARAVLARGVVTRLRLCCVLHDRIPM